MKTRKKWLRKTTAICTAALLGTAAIPSTAFAADSYASIEKDAWAKKVTEMASSYATSIEESQSLMSGMQSDMILKFEDSGRSLLGFVAPFDVSWLDNVTLSNDISFTEGKEGILMKVLLNDNKICTLEYYLDPDSQDIYMRIPELSDKYFKTNRLDKYGSMLFDNVTEGKSSQETLTAGDISQDCTVYEGQISAEDAVKTATAILEEAKSDSDIENILDTWTEKLSSNEDLHESFTKAVEDGLDFLKDADTGDSDDSHLNTRIWVDETGRIAGRKIEFQEGDKITPVLNWQMTRDGSDFGYLLSIETDDSGTLSLSGSGQIDGGKLNGTYKISQDDTAAAVIEVKDYDTESAKEGYLNGNYTITFPADSSEDTDSSLSMLENFALVLNLNSAKDSGSVALSVESAGSTLGSFTVTSGAGESVEIPDLTALGDVYDVTNEDDMSAYAATLDLTTLMDNLSNAGVPDEVITYVLSGGNNSDAEDVTDENAAEAESDADAAEAGAA